MIAKKTATLPEITSAAITVTTRTDSVRLVLSRNRTVGLARGTAGVDNPGRTWALQSKDGSWKAVGAKLTEGKDGAGHRVVPLRNGSYRLVGRLRSRRAGTASRWPVRARRRRPSRKGPKSLGKQVLFLTTDSGATPQKKGKELHRGGQPGQRARAWPSRRSPSAATRARTRTPRRPYKVKFATSQTPFGLPKGKKFILVPNYQDHALVRNAVATELARQLDGLQWTPHRVFTEVFLNGGYRGSYELIESIKIQEKSKKNDARVAIDPETGVIVEINPGTSKSAPGLLHGQARHATTASRTRTRAKKVDGKLDPEGVTPEKNARHEEEDPASSSPSSTARTTRTRTTGWQKYLDMDSAVDYYLENEFIKNWDGDFFRSTFFYTSDYANPDAKLFMGPIWDEDRTAARPDHRDQPDRGAEGLVDERQRATATTRQRGDVHKKHWFVRITQDKAFQKALKARWAEKRATFKAVGTTGIDTAVAELGKNVAANDRGKWQSTQPHDRFLPRAKTYNGEVRYLKNWYKARYRWMNGKLD